MATSAQLNTLQQLYIAYFGRPAEPAGFDWWVNRIDTEGLTLDQIANDFTSADEFVAAYGDDTAALVRAAYQNALGREVESEQALQFWVDQLESGAVTPAQLMNSFFGTDDANDRAVLENRTEVAAAYSQAVRDGATYDQAAASALLGSVDETQASVDAALEQVGVPGEAFTLTAGLEDLNAANAAKETFLESALENAILAKNQNLDENSTTDDAEAAVGAELTAQTATVAGDADVLDTNFGTRTASVQDSLIADAKAAKAKDLSDAVAEATEGVEALLAAVDAEVAATNAAIDAAAEAQTALTDAIAVFNSLSGETPIDATAFAENGDSVLELTVAAAVVAQYVDGAWELTDAGETAEYKRLDELLSAYDADVAADEAVGSAKAQLEAAIGDVYVAELDAYSAFDPQAAVVDYTAKDADGNADIEVNFDAQVKVFATKALADADAAGVKEKFTATFSEFADTNSVSFDTISYTASGTVTAAAAAAEFYAKYNAYADADWVAEYTTGSAAITFTAKEAAANTIAAFTDASSVVAESGRIDGIAPDQGTGAETAEAADLADDVYEAQIAVNEFNTLVEEFLNARELSGSLKAADAAIEAADAALTDSVEDGGLGVNLLEGAENFTTKNDVYLFNAEHGTEDLTNFGQTGEDKIFFGSGYKLVALGADEDMGDAVGDVSALEIFWDQQGSNLVLWVEEETFAGNGSTEADTVKITLTGVPSEDIAFVDGFLISGTAV